MLRTWGLLALNFCLLACSSVPISVALDRVQAGMSKHEVLEIADNPKHTYREQSQDHWVYIYFSGHQELSREVIFENGKVEKVTSARTKTNWEKEIEAAKAAGHESGFKSIDGNP